MKGQSVTFEEWYAGQNCNTETFMTYDELKELLLTAWDTAYELGYKECAMGIKPTQVELTTETLAADQQL